MAPQPAAHNRRLQAVLDLLGDTPKHPNALYRKAAKKGINPEDLRQGLHAGIRADLIDLAPEGRWYKVRHEDRTD